MSLSQPKLTIVMYHYVRPLALTRFPKIKGLDLPLFEEQLGYLAKHYSLISMEDLIDAIENRCQLPPRPALLTFDDGYLDHYAYVFPRLAERNLHGAFFPVSCAALDRKILDVNKIHFTLASDVDPKIIARGTPGFSGADLANLVNEAALMAARRGKRSVAMSEFEQAKDKVMMGAERRSMVMTEDEKKLTAYHEAGHALCMLYAEGHDPLHKVTIIPRGRALGVTMFLPERDKYSQSKIEIKAMLASLFGGRIAEELIFGPDKVTTGAADDIRRATGLARRMVTEFGFSEKLGPLRYAENEEEVFLGHSVTQRKNVSEATAKVIDEEIRRIIDEGEQTAREILSSRMDELHALAKGLLEYETLAVDEIRRIIKGERIVRETSTGPVTDEPRPGRRSSVPPSGRPTGLEPEPQPGG